MQVVAQRHDHATVGQARFHREAGLHRTAESGVHQSLAGGVVGRADHGAPTDACGAQRLFARRRAGVADGTVDELLTVEVVQRDRSPLRQSVTRRHERDEAIDHHVE